MEEADGGRRVSGNAGVVLAHAEQSNKTVVGRRKEAGVIEPLSRRRGFGASRLVTNASFGATSGYGEAGRTGRGRAGGEEP